MHVNLFHQLNNFMSHVLDTFMPINVCMHIHSEGNSAQNLQFINSTMQFSTLSYSHSMLENRVTLRTTQVAVYIP